MPTVTPSSTASPSPTASKAAPGAEKTYTADMIRIISQETSSRSNGKIESLKIQAPTNTSFKIGTGEPGALAIDCTSEALDGTTVIYLVSCPQQGSSQELFSSINDGAFSYGFTHNLK